MEFSYIKLHTHTTRCRFSCDKCECIVVVFVVAVAVHQIFIYCDEFVWRWYVSARVRVYMNC